MNVQTNVQVNPDTETYKRNQAKFYGEEYEIKSKGSIFEANKAAFYGQEY